MFVDNVLLERTASGFHYELQPHLGLISLIATLRALGHAAELIDPKIALYSGELRLGVGFYAAVAERIAARNPDVVGFTSLGCNFLFTLRIAEELRAMLPQVPVVLGGPHASIIDREILQRYNAFDVIVRGEAEATIGPLFEALEGSRRFDSIDGLSYRRNGEIARTRDAGPILDLDALPMGAYDAYPIEQLGLRKLDIDAGRGCPFSCSFCSTATFFGRKFRIKSAQRLVADLDALAERYGVRQFNLSHDLFTVNKTSVREFCSVVSGRGYGWTCSARMDCVDESLLREMSESGCNAMYYGVETGSPRLQKLVDKRLDLALYHPTVRRSRELKMNTVVSFMTGFPGETDDDRDATLELIRQTMEEHHTGVSVQLHLLTPEPGTALHSQHASSLAYDGYVGDFNVPLFDRDDRETIAADPDVFVCHHHYAVGGRRRDDIIIADAFRVLSRLGHAVFAALARTHGSGFANMLLAFSAIRSVSPDDNAAIIAFVRTNWGPAHPYVDIARYIIALEGHAGRELRSPDARDSGRFVLAPNVVPIADCRDAVELLRAVHAGRDEPLLGSERCDRLLFIPRDTARHAKMFAVDAATFAVARALETPATVEMLRERFGCEELDRRLWALELIGAI